jgi:hypothetical protein
MTEAEEEILSNNAFRIYEHLSRPVTKEKLELAEKAGMIGKAALKDGSHYFGECRNARIAVWSSEINLFVHWRYKWGYYLEDIPHPADDDDFDVFVPLKEVTLSDVGENDGKVRKVVSDSELKAYIASHLEWKARQAAWAKENPK